MLLGGLVLRSRYAPKVLAYVQIAAGVAYVLDSLAHTLLANYTDCETLLITVAVPAIITEGWLGLWLLPRAGKRPGGGATPTGY